MMNVRRIHKSALMLSLVLGFCGAIISCRNDQDEPKKIPEVVTGEISDVTYTGATVSGAITANGNSEITISGFVYSASNELPTTADSKTETLTSVGSFVSLLTNLLPGTTYHIRAYSTNAVGTGYGCIKD